MLQIGAITPALIDSTATSLALGVNDDDGYVMNAQPNGWQAIFGEYTPNLRPVDIIPRQVQCLQVVARRPARRPSGRSTSRRSTTAAAHFWPTPTPRALPSPASAR